MTERGRASPAGGINVGAVIAGFIVDFFGTQVGILALGYALGLDPADGEAFQRALTEPVAAQAATLLLGLAFVFLGGLVAARIAGAAELRHAFWVGLLSTGTSFAFLAAAAEMPPIWYALAGLVLTIPAAVAGGYAVQWRAKARQ